MLKSGGAFTNVRDVVEYFNHGVPQNPTRSAASTLTPRFTNPRGYIPLHDPTLRAEVGGLRGAPQFLRIFFSTTPSQVIEGHPQQSIT